MRVLVVDTDPDWRQQCAKWGFSTFNKIRPGYDLYVISSHLIGNVELPPWFVVATSRITTTEARDCYQAGALDYFEKDLSDATKDRILDNLGVQ